MQNDLSTLYVNGATVEAYDASEANALLVFVEQNKAKQSEKPKDPWSLAILFESKDAAKTFFRFILTKTIVFNPDQVRLDNDVALVDFDSHKDANSYRNELNHLISLAKDAQKGKQQESKFDSNWLSADYKPFGILKSEVYRLKENPSSKIKAGNNQHKKWQKEDQKNLAMISDYTIEKWKSEMLYLLDNNWAVKSESRDSERLVDAVISAFKDHVKTPCSSNIYTNSQLISKFCEGVEIYAGHNVNPEMPNFVRMLLQSNWTEQEDKMKSLEGAHHNVDESSRSLWDAIVKIASRSVQDLHDLAPNGYEEAVKAWENDEAIPSSVVLFNDSLMRGTDDILYSPSAALSIKNILYSDKEQGTKPLRSIVGFMVRDLMQCLGLIFTKKQRDHLTKMSRSLESLQKIDADTFWETSSDCLLAASFDQLFNTK